MLGLLSCAVGQPAAAQEDPFADAVHELRPGTNGGFNSELLPDVVLGPPRGTGLLQGSFDVLALGVGGEIVLRFDDPAICDGPGVDFTVFENAFHSGSLSGPIFDELGFVAVSADGDTFFAMPYDPESKIGLAGRTPVLSNPDNAISPLDPAVSGGDGFDLAAVGLSTARYVRITDVAGEIPDVGDLPPFLPAPNAGFDLDAVAAVHVCDGAASPTPTHTGLAAATATATPGDPSPSATPSAAAGTPTGPVATVTITAGVPTPTPSLLPGDVDGDGVVGRGDLTAVIHAIFARNGAADGSPADVNGDLRVTAADVVDVSARRSE